ncbi:MAG TPA: glucosyl-3-phosphoglycerate synthase [Acidimicrobiales bacterium]|nr:glucosyl-3-phosphoglycerate synthase [Acidimicrobiales bacterium]
MLRSFRFSDFDVAGLVEAKRGRRISVCLPARDEAETVGAIVAVIRSSLVEVQPLVDEILVIDDGSTDATSTVARDAGARVLATAPGGKGQAMWRAVQAAGGDLVVFCDADVRDFAAHFVSGLVGPLLIRDDVAFVKGCYDRPVDGVPGEGGRVTELVARPLIAALFPHLATLAQPLAGECAARRDVWERLPFVDGYGVDLGLVIDVASEFGLGAMAQCDLGQRVHRNRPLADLGPQALAIVQVALSRAGVAPDWESRLVRPGHEPLTVVLSERPPLVGVEPARRTA